MYFFFLTQVSEALRTIHNDSIVDETCPAAGATNSEDEDGNLIEREEIFNNLVHSTQLERENILFAHATDSLHVDEHCPDFCVVLLHGLKQVLKTTPSVIFVGRTSELKSMLCLIATACAFTRSGSFLASYSIYLTDRSPFQILVTICGTRMIPTPKMKDVFMDLHADSEPFLDGVAHRGMAVGALNILRKITPKLVETLEEHPEYNIMVIGYSLGAGICQLVVMDMLEGDAAAHIPDGTDIRCINFGSPPIFGYSNELEPEQKCPNIFSVVYNNDGLCSASAASVTRLFMQIRAVDKLQMRRRDMVQVNAIAVSYP